MRVSRGVAKAIVAADAIVLPANQNRVALVFSSDTTRPISVSFGTSVGNGAHVKIPVNSTPVVVTEHDIGELIKLDVHALSTGAATLPMIEVTDV